VTSKAGAQRPSRESVAATASAAGRNSRVSLPVKKPRRDQPWQRFRTTREGKAFIFVSAGVGLAAINTGNNLLFLIFGFMLSLIVMSGILSEIVLRRVRVARRLPERAFAGSTTLIEISLKNGKSWAPSYSLEVEDLAEGMTTERRCYFLKVAAQAEQVASYRRTFKRRGHVTLSGFRIATRYPFGMIEKWRMLPASEQVLVYPELVRDQTLDHGASLAGADAPTTRPGSGGDVAGLRHYQAGDAARSIHWRRTAALGRVVVFEMHSDSSARVTIVLDNARPAVADGRWDEGFERAISRAAALCVSCVGRELGVELVCRGQRSPLVLAGSPTDPILRFLALLQSVPAEHAAPFAAIGHGSRVVHVRVTPVEGAAAQADTAPLPAARRARQAS
jgi:uncharacterized protein (DUF58 family)